jgi:hypothetical protein
VENYFKPGWAINMKKNERTKKSKRRWLLETNTTWVLFLLVNILIWDSGSNMTEPALVTSLTIAYGYSKTIRIRSITWRAPSL